MKTFVVLSIAALCAAIGDTLLSQGMRSAPVVSVTSPGKLLDYLTVVVRNYHVTLGVVFMGLSFYLYLASLSWADVSYAKPITSLSFIFCTIFAALYLRENVSWPRWVGSLLIVLGVACVSLERRQLTDQSRHATPAGIESNK